MRYPVFLGDLTRSQSPITNPGDTVNFYVEKNPPGSTNDISLYPIPGYRTFTTTGQVGSRAACYANGRLFWIMATTLYEVLGDGTVTNRGTVAQDGNPATISYNGIAGGQLFITSGGNGYLFVLATNTLSTVLTNEATMGGFCHGYFLAFYQPTGKVRLSGPNDGSTWDPLQFFQRSLFADPWQAMFVDSQSFIWLPGTETFEVWYDTGAQPQPFAPLTGLVGRQGIAAPFAFGLADNDLFWLMQNAAGGGQIINPRADGPVSTYAVENALTGITLSDAEGLVHQYAGHTFFNLTFPMGNLSLCYDTQQPSWTRRGVWDNALNRFDIWSPRVHVYAFGKHLVGDRTSGIIAELTSESATELSGAGIRRVRVSSGLTDEHKRRPISRLEILMETGLGLSGTGQGSDPLVMLRQSQDGGQTWGNERQAGVGPIGAFKKRVYWTRFGAPMHNVFELSMSDPIPWRITDAWLNTDELAGQ